MHRTPASSYGNIYFDWNSFQASRKWMRAYNKLPEEKICDFYFRVNWLYFFLLSLLAVQRLKCVRTACECYVKRLLFHLSIWHSWIRQFLTHFHVDMDQIELWTFIAYQMWMFWNRIKVTTKRAVRKRVRQTFACQNEQIVLCWIENNRSWNARVNEHPRFLRFSCDIFFLSASGDK